MGEQADARRAQLRAESGVGREAIEAGTHERLP
jgi:hypothetical protein